ncbi:MAG: hypothetical protein PS018_11545 [bacterium]|nr:hypothetical protein [bacterium]
MRKKLGKPNPMRGGADFAIGRDKVFWCETPDAYLRRVGFADQFAGIRHNGWYLEDDYSDELARGVVFQLPARNGQTRFLSAVADPFNNGPAILSLEIFDDKDDAARNADELARIYAESERDYRRAWNAGAEFVRLGELIADIRRATLILFKARHTNPPLGADNAILFQVNRALRDICSARKERAQLQNDYGRTAEFQEALHA